MAFPVSPAQRQAFRSSHVMTTRVTVIRGTTSLGDIPIIGGSVSADYGTQGGRDAWIEVDRGVIDAGYLNPLSDEVVIRTGIPNVVEVPIFTGRVDTVSKNSDGSCQVQLLSRGAELTRAQFETPWAADPAGTQARFEMRSIIQSINGLWGVTLDNANINTIPSGLVWEQFPGDALDDLARGASLIWQPDRSGGFTIYTNPYVIGTTLGENPVVSLRSGTGGVTVDIVENLTRDGVWNSVTVVVERVDNSVPIRVTVRDNTVGSPTRWGGVFGKQNLVMKSQTPIDASPARDIAVRILRQSLALRRSFEVSMPHMPLLDPGDVFELQDQGVNYFLVAERVSYSVQGKELTNVSARELVFLEDFEEILST